MNFGEEIFNESDVVVRDLKLLFSFTIDIDSVLKTERNKQSIAQET